MQRNFTNLKKPKKLFNQSAAVSEYCVKLTRKLDLFSLSWRNATICIVEIENLNQQQFFYNCTTNLQNVLNKYS